MTSQYPIAARKPHERTLHGDTFVDHYEWLREKSSPEVLAYLHEENAYCEQATAHLEPLIDDIFGEIKARVQETDLSVPVYREHTQGEAFWYYTRTLEGKDYAIYCRVPATSMDDLPDPSGEIAGEQVLLDGNVEAEGTEFFSLGAFSVSPDGRLLGYLVDNAGDERYTLRLKDLTTGELLPDTIDDLSWGLTWAGDEWLFYTRVDEAWRPFQIWRHRVGTDPSEDALVLQEDDEMFWISCHESRDGAVIVFHAASKLTSEVRILPTSTPTGEPRLVAPREPGLDYSVEWAGDRLLILHNADCVDFAISQAPVDATSRDQWEPVVAGVDGVRLLGIDAFARHVVVELRRDGLTGVHVIDRDAEGNLQPGHDLTFDEELYTVYPMPSPVWTSERLRLGYTSLLTPASVLEVDLATGEQTVLKRTPVLDDPTRGAYDPADYVQKREWATAEDGTRIPVSIVHRKDLVLDGSNPCHLYGYGSYEFCVDPTFAITRLPLLERGVVYAIAHVRGGGEMGRGWYDDGKMLTKKHTFSDFVDVAKHLIAQGYTNPERLAAEGRSAGGLLMGAICNLAPELFRCVHAGVPFVDALTSMVMPDLPLTVTEWEEWGDPFHDPTVYAYMKEYTPYENVRSVPYPSILATTSLNDTRVLYVEPAKWVALLRHTLPETDGRTILLQTEMVAGHGGVSGRYGKWRQLAFEYAWMLDQLGVA